MWRWAMAGIDIIFAIILPCLTSIVCLTHSCYCFIYNSGMPPTKNNKKNPVDHSSLNVLGDDTATHKVQGLSLGDQSLETLVEEINPFF